MSQVSEQLNMCIGALFDDSLHTIFDETLNNINVRTYAFFTSAIYSDCVTMTVTVKNLLDNAQVKFADLSKSTQTNTQTKGGANDTTKNDNTAIDLCLTYYELDAAKDLINAVIQEWEHRKRDMALDDELRVGLKNCSDNLHRITQDIENLLSNYGTYILRDACNFENFIRYGRLERKSTYEYKIQALMYHLLLLAEDVCDEGDYRNIPTLLVCMADNREQLNQDTVQRIIALLHIYTLIDLAYGFSMYDNYYGAGVKYLLAARALTRLFDYNDTFYTLANDHGFNPNGAIKPKNIALVKAMRGLLRFLPDIEAHIEATTGDNSDTATDTTDTSETAIVDNVKDDTLADKTCGDSKVLQPLLMIPDEAIARNTYFLLATLFDNTLQYWHNTAIAPKQLMELDNKFQLVVSDDESRLFVLEKHLLAMIISATLRFDELMELYPNRNKHNRDKNANTDTDNNFDADSSADTDSNIKKLTSLIMGEQNSPSADETEFLIIQLITHSPVFFTAFPKEVKASSVTEDDTQTMTEFIIRALLDFWLYALADDISNTNTGRLSLLTYTLLGFIPDNTNHDHAEINQGEVHNIGHDNLVLQLGQYLQDNSGDSPASRDMHVHAADLIALIRTHFAEFAPHEAATLFFNRPEYNSTGNILRISQLVRFLYDNLTRDYNGHGYKPIELTEMFISHILFLLNITSKWIDSIVSNYSQVNKQVNAQANKYNNTFDALEAPDALPEDSKTNDETRGESLPSTAQSAIKLTRLVNYFTRYFLNNWEKEIDTADFDSDARFFTEHGFIELADMIDAMLSTLHLSSVFNESFSPFAAIGVDINEDVRAVLDKMWKICISECEQDMRRLFNINNTADFKALLDDVQ